MSSPPCAPDVLDGRRRMISGTGVRANAPLALPRFTPSACTMG
ncbi:hypothetical protein SLNWT_1565 [Streptomyces albus]|uniref:Uncharacterized protein n=1 Tax=Streptomyces albus (strain ATCC 21838 / DSM 41398 / FERM P-419 / JCM 4703 / NBRC 107858) TaxID=1081613 RepID=A0A0B5ET71_STRA4|nr:hypothetical protein SLNWT_1565 [Streptomyces albus]AOU76258.1 hypothetical protein SLNHY_1567 [Streptomyces albus]AYN32046.1 hypothetical protein DUI70_1542 [Streptomyces albus]